jgi:tetratricopeptide (TPR) repeat protein
VNGIADRVLSRVRRIGPERLASRRGGRHAALAAILVGVATAFAAHASPDSPISVRVGEHPEFSRIVFDWPSAVGYDVETRREAGKLFAVIRFAQKAEFDFGLLARRPARRFALHQSTTRENASEIVLKLTPKAEVRSLRSDSKVVVDIYTPWARAPIIETAGGPETKQAKTEQPGATPETPAAPTSPAASLEGEVSTKPRITPALIARETGLSLGFSFPGHGAANAAVFERAGRLWLVFDRAAEVDLAALAHDPAGSALALEQIAHPNATVLSLSLPQGATPSLSREGEIWTLVVPNRATLTETESIAMTVDPEAKGGGQVRFGLNAGTVVTLDDPVVGDRLAVVAVDAPNRGVAVGRDFVQFAVLPSYQGIVLRAKSEGIDLKPDANGFQVTSADGLFLSLSPFAPMAQTLFFRFADWRTAGDFQAEKQRLLDAAALAPEGGRAAARLELAQFYFAHGLAAETLAVLALIAQDTGDAVHNRLYRALRGAASLRLGRLDEAGADFDQALLDGLPEIALWRGLLAAARNDWPKAHSRFAESLGFVDKYPPDLRARFRLAMVRGWLSMGEYSTAKAELAILRQEPMTPAEKEEADLLLAEILAPLGVEDEASETLAKLANAGHRRVRGRAEFLKIEDDLARQSIDVKQAIARLDRLRFVWRGDRFEFDVLRRLAELYLEQKDYRNSLVSLRAIASRFPREPETPELRQRFAEAFHQLFTGADADKLAPLTAVSLYFDFRDVLPGAGPSIAVIDKLVDRLIQVDLLARAAELMEQQLVRRAAGGDKAKAGAKLALVYMLDGKPEAALKALEATAASFIDPGLASERRRLEASAKMALGKTEEALSALGQDDDAQALLLRADIHWMGKNWLKAAEALDAVLGERWRPEVALTEQDRQQLLKQAVALALADERGKLEELRARYQNKLAGTAQADAFAVVSDPILRQGRKFRELAQAIAQTSQLDAFLARYRQTQTADAKTVPKG